MAAGEGNEESTKGPHVRLRGHNITPARPLHATCTHHNVPRHLHHSRHWPPNKMIWRSTEHGGWLTVDDDTPAASELATAQSQSSFQACRDHNHQKSLLRAIWQSRQKQASQVCTTSRGAERALMRVIR